MVNRVDLLAFEFYKKKPFKGSDTGARYMVTKEEVVSGGAEDGTEEKKTVLACYMWPEPFCFEATADEVKIRGEFPFSEEGLGQAVDYINKYHDEVAHED